MTKNCKKTKSLIYSFIGKRFCKNKRKGEKKIESTKKYFSATKKYLLFNFRAIEFNNKSAEFESSMLVVESNILVADFYVFSDRIETSVHIIRMCTILITKST